jgi:hypothetical protein
MVISIQLHWMVISGLHQVKLNSNINSKNWEPSAFISADGHTIYFSSDRPGGFGNRDLYMSEKNRKWGMGKSC